ncbi:hypothetical protein Pta02_61230 [Planobispora takensis]|uniref:Uncharacterized protein n=1 Tax=Planobispora takensis TaxID=1367882 RepID=A0A8J3T3B0_9ACTN|nr:hypothetical protein Pta02_61230 [Planobispora takensis]
MVRSPSGVSGTRSRNGAAKGHQHGRPKRAAADDVENALRRDWADHVGPAALEGRTES